MGYSKHALKRSVQRFGSENSLYSVKFLKECGYTKTDFRKGSSMRKYLSRKEIDGCYAIVYDRKVYIIHDNMVVTTYPLKGKYFDGYDW